MTYKIYQCPDALMVRFSAGVDVEMSLDDWQRLAGDIHRLGGRVRRATWTPKMKEDMRRMYVDENMGVAEIARAMGIEAKAAANMRQRLGLPPHNPEKANNLNGNRPWETKGRAQQ
jgi:transposase-like protein